MFDSISIAYNNAAAIVLSKWYNEKAKRYAKRAPHYQEVEQDDEIENVPRYHIRCKLTADSAKQVDEAKETINDFLQQLRMYDDKQVARIVEMFGCVIGAEVESKCAPHYLMNHCGYSEEDIEMYESAMKTICSSKQFVEMIETGKQSMNDGNRTINDISFGIGSGLRKAVETLQKE